MLCSVYAASSKVKCFHNKKYRQLNDIVKNYTGENFLNCLIVWVPSNLQRFTEEDDKLQRVNVFHFAFEEQSARRVAAASRSFWILFVVIVIVIGNGSSSSSWGGGGVLPLEDFVVLTRTPRDRRCASSQWRLQQLSKWSVRVGRVVSRSLSSLRDMETLGLFVHDQTWPWFSFRNPTHPNSSFPQPNPTHPRKNILYTLSQL